MSVSLEGALPVFAQSLWRIWTIDAILHHLIWSVFSNERLKTSPSSRVVRPALANHQTPAGPHPRSHERSIIN